MRNLPVSRSASRPIHETVPSALVRYTWTPDAPPRYAMVDAQLRKVLRTGEQAPVHFDLRQDLCEGVVAREPVPELEQRLQAWLDEQERRASEHRERHGGVLSTMVEAGDMEMLRALGYLEE